MFLPIVYLEVRSWFCFPWGLTPWTRPRTEVLEIPCVADTRSWGKWKQWQQHAQSAGGEIKTSAVALVQNSSAPFFPAFPRCLPAEGYFRTSVESSGCFSCCGAKSQRKAGHSRGSVRNVRGLSMAEKRKGWSAVALQFTLPLLHLHSVPHLLCFLFQLHNDRGKVRRNAAEAAGRKKEGKQKKKTWRSAFSVIGKPNPRQGQTGTPGATQTRHFGCCCPSQNAISVSTKSGNSERS